MTWNRQKKWIDRKRQDGWKHVQFLVPSPLADLLKELVRKWKYENPEHWEKNT